MVCVCGRGRGRAPTRHGRSQAPRPSKSVSLSLTVALTLTPIHTRILIPVLYLPARAPPPCPCSTHSRTPDTSGTKHHRPGIPRPPRAHRPRMRHKEHQSHKHRRRGSAAPIGRARRNHRGAACRARPSEQNGARSAIEPGLSADIWLLVSVLSFRVYCTMCGRRPSRSSCRRSGPSSRKA